MDDITRTVLVELWGFVGLAALLTVFYPQQSQSNAARLHFTVYPPVVRHLVGKSIFVQAETAAVRLSAET